MVPAKITIKDLAVHWTICRFEGPPWIPDLPDFWKTVRYTGEIYVSLCERGIDSFMFLFYKHTVCLRSNARWEMLDDYRSYSNRDRNHHLIWHQQCEILTHISSLSGDGQMCLAVLDKRVSTDGVNGREFVTSLWWMWNLTWDETIDQWTYASWANCCVEYTCLSSVDWSFTGNYLVLFRRTFDFLKTLLGERPEVGEPIRSVWNDIVGLYFCDLFAWLVRALGLDILVSDSAS